MSPCLVIILINLDHAGKPHVPCTRGYATTCPHYSAITDSDKNGGDKSELEVVLALLAVSGKDKVCQFFQLERR